MNIVLIGMPGCGKSTVGVLLAKRLGMSFVDTDLLIQERTGELLQETIDSKGDEVLLAVEQDVIRGLDCDSAVISTGGSAVYSKSGMHNLKSGSVTVYIRITLETVQQRINNLDTRGVVGAKNRPISEIYEERARLYEHYADIAVDSDSLTIEQAVDAVEAAVRDALKA